ncbi:hypothetical protein KFU94_57855 [Chloroflexi bacterium TSY]|nr:hypothetical protein [Chloroflexi bacterium TSY]
MFYTVIVALAEWLLIWQTTVVDTFMFNHTTDDLIVRMIVWLSAGYSMTWLMRRQREQRQALIEANERQIEANAQLASFASTVEQLSVTRERNRLARELHDTLAHSLSAASVQIEAVHSLWSVNEAQARAMLTSVDDTVRTGLKEARRYAPPLWRKLDWSMPYAIPPNLPPSEAT